MIDSIRTLGLLFLQKNVKDITQNSFESPKNFEVEREAAIRSGEYARYQFEPQQKQQVGVFKVSPNGESFEIVTLDFQDSWKLLFLKTPPNAIYFTPTWKSGGQSKLDKTIKEIRNSEAKGSDKSEIRFGGYASTLRQLFDSKTISSAFEGHTKVRTFLETLKAAERSKVKIFTVKIDGRWPGEIPEMVREALDLKPRLLYQTRSAQAIEASDQRTCSVCHQRKVALYPNVLAAVGINIANVDKTGFFPDLDGKFAWKSFPICAYCAELLYVAKFFVFNSLTVRLARHTCLIIPHLIEGSDCTQMFEVLEYGIEQYAEGMARARRVEKNVLHALGDLKGVSAFSFLFGDIKGQSVDNIRKVLPNVLPTRLSEVAEVMASINQERLKLDSDHPFRGNTSPLDDQLKIFFYIFGYPKYVPVKGGRKFKSHTVNVLDLLAALWFGQPYPLDLILSDFSNRLSFEFREGLADEKYGPFSHIQSKLRDMYFLLKFLTKTEVINMPEGTNLVTEYLRDTPGLERLQGFLAEDAKGLDTEEKQYAFLVGLLFGKLVKIQQARGVRVSAFQWLKGFHFAGSDLPEIYTKLVERITTYFGAEKKTWSDAMEGVNTAIAGLGASIGDRWTISPRHVPYYFALGMSLVDFFLPKKHQKGETNE